jgi:hypothetical protein
MREGQTFSASEEDIDVHMLSKRKGKRSQEKLIK